jgi:DNA-binding CsgD family transcriptional regulator
MPKQRPLTPRQHVILRAVARGATNKEIANELGISEQGVKVHISRLLERYDAGNRVELVNLAHAWTDTDDRAYASLAADVAAVRSGLTSGYSRMSSLGELRASRDQASASALRSTATDLSPQAPAELVDSARSLRDLLNEVNVAVKLARELPDESVTGPLIDAIRARVQSALAESERLASFLDRERSNGSGNGRSRHDAV